MTNCLVGESARYRYFSDDGMGRRSGVLIIAPGFAQIDIHRTADLPTALPGVNSVPFDLDCQGFCRRILTDTAP